MPNTIPEKPWSHISADFITKLLLAQRYDAVRATGVELQEIPQLIIIYEI